MSMDTNNGTSKATSDVTQVLKQPTSGVPVPNPAQIPPQSFSVSMMQQAVALQQFQFQQALMVQQMVAQQQAAARAVNVKTAADLAVARAAEISKLLKGENAGDEKGKVDESSPHSGACVDRARSVSGSPSPSRSSRSKSRSPIRYRRGHSMSRSPIRYRRERYSPREYRNYRGRGYRNYYRGGRGDYSRSSYRRDWDRARDRDCYYRGRRSTSRSRLRRSPTHSRSPRRRHNRSPSPRRDERRSGRSSRRDRSRLSRSPLISRESPSVSSEHVIERSSRRSRGGRSVAYSRRSSSWGSMSPIRKDGNVSVDDGSSSEKHISSGVKPQSRVGPATVRRVQREKRAMSEQDIESRDGSSSPARSLSISMDHSSSDTSKDTQIQARKNKKHIADSRYGAEKSVYLDMEQDPNEVASEDGVKLAKQKATDNLSFWHVPQTRSNQGFKVRNCSDENSEDKNEEEIDDWRNDIKARAIKRLKQLDNQKEERRAKQEEEKKSTSWSSGNQNQFYSKARTQTPCEGESQHQDSILKGKCDLNEKQARGGNVSSNEEDGQTSSLKETVDEKNRQVERTDSEDEEQSSMQKGGDENVKEERRRIDKQWSSHVSDIEEKVESEYTCAVEVYDPENEEIIYERPQPASENYGCSEQINGGNEVDKGVSDILKKDSKLVDEREQTEDVGTSVMLPADFDAVEDEQSSGYGPKVEVIENNLSKYRSRSKEKKGKHEDHASDTRRKHRIKKHRRRHKREEEEEDAFEGKESGSHKEKRKHKKSHKKHDDVRREKKKRKHKHRARSVSSSLEGSVASDVGVKEEDSNVTRKKLPSHHKRKREPSTSGETSSSE
eukprot:Gb_29976 [translate_table: standard]